MVGRLTSPLIFSIYTGIKALYKPSTTQYQSVPSDNEQVPPSYEELGYEEYLYEECHYEERHYKERHYEESHYEEHRYEERRYEKRRYDFIFLRSKISKKRKNLFSVVICNLCCIVFSTLTSITTFVFLSLMFFVAYKWVKKNYFLVRI